MKPHHFASLAAAALVSLIAALVAYSTLQQRSSATPAGARLFPGLEAQADKIARVELQQADRTVTLEKKGETWSIKEKDGFLASTEKVRALLVSLTTAELAEAKTKSEMRLPLLELEDRPEAPQPCNQVDIATRRRCDHRNLRIGLGAYGVFVDHRLSLRGEGLDTGAIGFGRQVLLAVNVPADHHCEHDQAPDQCDQNPGAFDSVQRVLPPKSLSWGQYGAHINVLSFALGGELPQRPASTSRPAR